MLPKLSGKGRNPSSIEDDTTTMRSLRRLQRQLRGGGEVVEAMLSYVEPPSSLQQRVGYDVDAVATSGLPPFSFRRQHGAWPVELEPDVVAARFASNSVVPRAQRVRDARPLEPSLATNGFELRAAEPLPPDAVEDEAFVETTYYDSVITLVKAATGARVVKPYDHVRRHSGESKPLGSGPAAFLVHTDSAHKSWQWRTDDILRAGAWDKVGPTNIDEAFAKRYMAGGSRWSVVNVWRHISSDNVLAATPLGLLDDTTVAWNTEEVLLYPITMQGTVAFNYALQYSPRHAWYYFPRMTRAEVLLFQAYASPGQPGPRAVFHTAFELPGQQRAYRESLEVRCIACDFEDDH